MELAAQVEAKGVRLVAEWAPRELNAEADALTNLVFTGFDMSRRKALTPDELPLLVMPSLMEEAARFYDLVQERRARQGGRAPRGGIKRKAQRPLRERVPC
jgi:hypothetical protein